MYKLCIPLSDELAELIKQAANNDSRSMAGWVKLTLERNAKEELNK